MKVYSRLSSAYGTIMFAVLVYSILTQQHITFSGISLWLAPLIALAYAVIRFAIEENPVLFSRKTINETEISIDTQERA